MDSGSRQPRTTRSGQEVDAVSRRWRLIAAGWGKARWRAIAKRMMRRRERRAKVDDDGV